MSQFEGFPKDLHAFLSELEDNNNRDWFHAHKDRYEESVREPALSFVRAMGKRMKRTAPHLAAIDKKVGGSLMRIHRDVRFSKDKSPYKTNVGIHFRHDAGKDVHAPGLYLHIANDEHFFGAGMWMPDGPSLQLIRAKIDEEQARWKRIIGAKAIAGFGRDGEGSLKRPPRGYDKDHPLVDELKRKSHVLVADYDPAVLASDEVVKELAAFLKAAKPMMTFLCEAIDQPF